MFPIKTRLAGLIFLIAFISSQLSLTVFALDSYVSALDETSNLVRSQSENDELLKRHSDEHPKMKHHRKKGRHHHRKKEEERKEREKKKKEKERKARQRKKNEENHKKNRNKGKHAQTGGHPEQKQHHPKINHKPGQQNSDATSSSSPLSSMVFHNSKCSNPKATKQRPNGCVSFLNCNIDGPGGWNPPPVTMNHLKMLSLDELAKTEVFEPCKKYMANFQSVQEKFGIPGTLLASIALQESSCSKTCRGPNGEIGLMQLTPENCKQFGVDPGDAWNVETNIILGAKQFKQALEQYGGNVIIALGYYNGWQKGMSESQARSKKWGCFAQNNLDYIDQMLNAWFLGKDGYTKEFQTYNNLAECG